MYKAYASYFVSYLITELKSMNDIIEIILFGSAVREEATKESDIDIFINLKKEDKKLGKKIDELVEKFYTTREALIFKTKEIDNKINVITGKVEDWPDLKRSIESTGIVLYGNYKSSKSSGRKNIIVFWEAIEKNRGAFLNKIYGFKVKNKKYNGLLDKYSGIKLGKSNIMLPIEYKEEILSLIKHHKVSAKILEVYY